jgi:peptidoglycan/LPS O-acetylase OafA/YrhL
VKRHVPALDGVRGIAILMVMIGHFWIGSRPDTGAGRAFYGLVQNGWIGVDLFFVLSGFLITGILLGSKGSDGYFRNFYARRALRIFPLYYGFLFLWFFVLPAVFDISARATYAVDAKTQFWFWTYLSNFLSVIPNAETPHGINHFWTLAIEEQFYLVWPAVVLAFSRRTLRWICLAMIPAGLAFRLWLMTTDYAHTGGYVLTPARMGTLGMGAWLALALQEPIMKAWIYRHASKFLIGSVIALGALNFPDLRMYGSEPAMQTIGFPLLAIFAASVIVYAVRSDRPGRWYQRVLTSRRLRFFGKYSYGMYVLHLPIVVCFETLGFGVESFPRVGGSDLLGALAFTTTCLATVTMAALISWNLVEKRFLRLKSRFPSPG